MQNRSSKDKLTVYEHNGLTRQTIDIIWSRPHDPLF